MGKKNKKFGKKNHKSSYVAPAQGVAADQTISNSSESNAAISQTIIQPEAVQAPEAPVEDPRYKVVRRETKKVLAILATLLLVLVGTYFLGQKTSVLNNLGNYLYRTANIQAQ